MGPVDLVQCAPYAAGLLLRLLLRLAGERRGLGLGLLLLPRLLPFPAFRLGPPVDPDEVPSHFAGDQPALRQASTFRQCGCLALVASGLLLGLVQGLTAHFGLLCDAGGIACPSRFDLFGRESGCAG
ncbi:hypothetical protein ADL01_03790 [Streptomyces sp. NRRL WC-3618]|nr:hypothetical protein ADL01_03790 [Streptomyces sp. NRRL WC-3618]